MDNWVQTHNRSAGCRVLGTTGNGDFRAVQFHSTDNTPFNPFVLFSQVIEIQLSSFIPHVSGPKRPQDRVAVSDMKVDFHSCLKEKVRVQPSIANTHV